MARSYGHIRNSIWRDISFRSLTVHAQHLYMLILTQPNLSHAGIVPLTSKRWASLSRDNTSNIVEEALQELRERGLVKVDWETEEVFVQSCMEDDGVHKQPQLWRTIRTEMAHIASVLLRKEVEAELVRLGITEVGDREPTRNKLSKRRRFQILERDKFTCRYCGSSAAELVIDHVLPVSLGGADHPDNLVACCVDCNAGKSAAPLASKLPDAKETDVV